MRTAVIQIRSVARGEFPKDGERVIGLSTCFGHMDPFLLTLPSVFWNQRKKQFTYQHGAPLSGSSVEFWFYEAELTSRLQGSGPTTHERRQSPLSKQEKSFMENENGGTPAETTDTTTGTQEPVTERQADTAKDGGSTAPETSEGVQAPDEPQGTDVAA